MKEGSIIRKIILGLMSLAIAGFCYRNFNSFTLFLGWEVDAANWRLKNGRYCPLDRDQYAYIGIDKGKYDGEFPLVLEKPDNQLSDDERIMKSVAVKNYPWSREVWAAFIDKVMQAGAKCIIIDIVFPSEGDGDAQLKAMLDKYSPRVVIGSMFEESGEATVFLTPSPTIIEPDEFGETSEDIRVGLVNIFPEPEDGMFKRGVYNFTMWDVYQRMLDPELAAQLGDMGKDVVLESLSARAVALMGRAENLPAKSVAPLIRFTGPPEKPFKMIPLWRILYDQEWETKYRDQMKDKVVLIGPYANFFHDEHQTPLGIMKGPEYHLNLINAAYHGEFIRETTLEEDRRIVLFTAIFTVLMTVFFKRYFLRFYIGLALTALYAWLVMWFYNEKNLMLGSVIVPMFLLNTNNVMALALESFWNWLDKQRFEATMGRYFSPAVLKEVRENPGSLDAKSAEVTLLLTDLRNSTPLAERLGPTGMFKLLNQVFEAQTDAIMGQDGQLEHFLGDQFLSYWGAPQDQPGGPNQALRAARDLIVRMEKVKEIQPPEVKEIFGYGVALHRGFALVGNKGSEKKMEYGLVGDTINEAARIEALTKHYQTQLLVSEELFERLSDPGRHRLVDRVIVKGKSEPVVLYELEQMKSPPEFDRIAADYAVAFEEYTAGKFESAREKFQKLVDEFDDGPSKVMLERCRQLIAKPRDDWRGVWKMESK